MTAWEGLDVGFCATEVADGAMRFEFEGQAVAHCERMTRTGFELDDAEVTLEVPAIVDGEGVEVFFRAIDSERQVLEMGQSPTELWVRVGDLLDPRESFPLDPDVAWWRIRETDGMTYFETKVPAADWTIVASRSTPFDVSAVKMMLGADLVSAPATVTTIGAYNPLVP
jgi:hypothetical protein